MKRLIVAWLWAAVCSLAVASGGRAFAQERKRVVVLEFEGPGAASVRKHVLAALKERRDVELASPKKAESARKKLGVQWGEAEAYQRVGAQLGASAFVEGDVEKVGKKVRARIRVRDASSGAVLHEEPWTRKAVPQLKAVRENFWKVMGPHISGSSVPAAAAPEPAPAPEEEPEPLVPEQPLDTPEPSAEPPVEEAPEPARAAGDARPALIAWLGPRLMWRKLSYEEDTNLDRYRIAASKPAFNLALSARWFPAAHVRSDWLADLGLEADLDYSIGLKSQYQGKEYKTTAYEIGAGALYRIPLDTFEPRIRLGYVLHKFDSDLPATTTLPGVSYSSLRIGLGTAIRLVDWLSVDVDAAYLHVLDAGEIATAAYTSDFSARAFEFGGALVTHFATYFGVRLGVDFRRYVLDFKSDTAAAQDVPNEGADHYLRTTLAFVFELPGGG